MAGMKVVLCGPYPYDAADQASGGGLMQAMVVLSEALARTPEVDVHVLTRSPRLVREVTEPRGEVEVTWVPDSVARVDYLLDRRVLRRRLVRRLERIAPDVVNAHGEAPFILAALELGVPHVITLHGIFARQTLAYGRSAPLAYRLAYSQMRRWERQYIPRIENLIAINASIAEYVGERAPSVRIFRVNNAVDPAVFSIPDREAKPTVLFVGQISRLKGLDVLLDAFARVAIEHPDARLRIAGGSVQDPQFESELRRRFAELIARGSIAFLGPLPREAVFDELSRCSMLCLPSLYEASPLVVIEAMAAGKPVVATRVGDVSELVEASGAGTVVAPGDAAGLADALEGMLSDPDRRRTAGQRGRAEATRRASPDTISRETVSVFREVTGRRLSREP